MAESAEDYQTDFLELPCLNIPALILVIIKYIYINSTANIYNPVYISAVSYTPQELSN